MKNLCNKKIPFALWLGAICIMITCLYAEVANTKIASDSDPIGSQENDGFITPQEYGANLYENPRGIGCIKCHGQDGEETLLASYIHKGKEKHLIVPRINNLEFDAFKLALSKDGSIMPKYNLTDEEINAIYLFITSRNKTFR